MNREPTRLVLSVLLALAATAAGAAQAPSKVLALSDVAPMLLQVDPACSTGLCSTGLPTVTQPYAGGVAHDPRDRCTWVSDGLLLAKVDARNACAPCCLPIPAPNLAIGDVVTGLAFNEWTQTLFVSHSNNSIHVFTTVGCALTFQFACVIALPTNHVISGLATDDVNNLLYYASSPWLGPSSVPVAQIYVAPQGAPCASLCGPGVPLQNCTGSIVTLVTGLGFDPCAGFLYASDQNLVYKVVFAGCTASTVSCCLPLAGLQLTGLCVLPSTEVSSHITCFAGTVPTCATMRHVLRGDPTIGNANFALDLVNAPLNTLAFLQADLGPCNPTTSFGICDLMPTTNLWIQFTGVGTGCTGAASCPLGLPPLPVFCGIILSTRWCGIQGPPTNNYVSNCLSWMISGS